LFGFYTGDILVDDFLIVVVLAVANRGEAFVEI
jgi:hypothetical protein